MAFFGKKDKDGGETAGTPQLPAVRTESGVTPPHPSSRPQVSGQTTIGPTLRIKGEITGDEDVTIEGRVEGIVSLNRGLVVGKTGILEADVRALNVIVHGRVVGNIIAEGRVEIHPTGKLEGNIKSPKISIHEGAQFRGNVDMSGGAGGGMMLGGGGESLGGAASGSGSGTHSATPSASHGSASGSRGHGGGGQDRKG